MAGVRRRLRDVGKTVSGVLAGRPVEGAESGTPEQQEVGAVADSPLPGSTAPGGAAPDGPAPDAAGREAAHDAAPAHDATAAVVDDLERAALDAGAAEAVAEEQAVTGATGIAPAPTAEVDDPHSGDPVPLEAAPAEADPVLAAAVDLARAVAVEVAGDAVGAHLGVEADGPPDGGPAATHSFATTDPAYVGWRWAVTVARADGSDQVTVDEVVLLPGAGALLAPAWLPWAERVQPGDLSPGDMLPTDPDDPRLVPSYATEEDDLDLADAVWDELGLGRERVLSVEGRLETAERWYDGDAGPRSPLAKQAPASCVSCGFLVPLGGALRQAFGACANALAPDDGRVVALDHGCGAHSEVAVDSAHAATAGMAVEDDEFELVPTES